jgi:uncharacterized protein (UPF0335 family)
MTIPNFDRPKLKGFVSEIETLERDKLDTNAAIKEVYERAKEAGFDPKGIRLAVRHRMEDEKKRKAREDLRDFYLHALGDLADTELGVAAMQAAGVTVEVQPRVAAE